MKYIPHTFSRRFAPVECALFVIHEKPNTTPYVEYDPREGLPVGIHYRATAVAIILPSGIVYAGVALCSPLDQYVRKVGQAKAAGRAVQDLKRGRVAIDLTAVSEELRGNLVRKMLEAKIRIYKQAVVDYGYPHPMPGPMSGRTGAHHG